MDNQKVIRLGARGSALSLAQVDLVQSALTANSVKTEFQVISTVGCRKQGTAEAAIGDKRNWMHDLEVALLANEIDIAIHSAKDVPAEIDASTVLIPVLKRARSGDIFIGRKLENGERLAFADIPQNATVGTSSLRRQAELLRVRPDLTIIAHRGNITTRMEKLDANPELAGIVLAAAGFDRLGLSVGEEFADSIMLPAINQGILVAHCRKDDEAALSAVSALVDAKTEAAFLLERACITELEGDCHSAIGCFACADEQSITGSVRIYSVDGKEMVAHSVSGSTSEAWNLGVALGKACLSMGGDRLLKEASLFNARVAEPKS
jgi:hydroxymethylbilane synthase